MIKKILSVFIISTITGCTVVDSAATSDFTKEDKQSLLSDCGTCTCELPNPCIDAVPGAIVQDSTLCTYKVCQKNYDYLNNEIDPSTVIKNKPTGTVCWFTQGEWANPETSFTGTCDPNANCNDCDGHFMNDMWFDPHNECLINSCEDDLGMGRIKVYPAQDGTECTNDQHQLSTCLQGSCQ
jgi:hypothetical protein